MPYFGLGYILYSRQHSKYDALVGHPCYLNTNFKTVILSVGSIKYSLTIFQQVSKILGPNPIFA